MIYHAEYSIAGEYCFHCRSSKDLKALLLQIRADGCRMQDSTITRALEWSLTAKDGDKFYGGCTFTILKGEPRMTEYTSF